jgi:uncharacterized membrane protein
MKGTLITIGIILVILGLLMSGSPMWMWTLIILGVIGILWGWMSKGKGNM